MGTQEHRIRVTRMGKSLLVDLGSADKDDIATAIRVLSYQLPSEEAAELAGRLRSEAWNKGTEKQQLVPHRVTREQALGPSI